MPIGVPIVLSVIPGSIGRWKWKSCSPCRIAPRSSPGITESAPSRSAGTRGRPGRPAGRRRRPRGRRCVVGRGGVRGDPLAGHLELDGLGGLADRVGIEGGGGLGVAHAGEPNKPGTLFCILCPCRAASELANREDRMSNAHVRDRRRHDQVRQARHQGGRLPRLGQGGRGEGARRRRHPLHRRRAGLRRLLLRRLDLRPARALRARPDRDPGRQRQQQLLDRHLGAVPRAPGGHAAGSPTARSRSASRRWRRARSASSTPTAPTPLDKHVDARCSRCASPRSRPLAPQMFGNAGRDHMEKYGSEPDHYAWIGWKNHKHSVNNPYAQFQDRVLAGRDQGRADDPLAADQAAVLADLRRLGLRDRRVGALRRRARPLGPGGRDRRPGDGHRPQLDRSTTTPTASRSSATTCRRRPRARPTRRPASTPSEVDVCELHDCFSANELITYEALGFAAEGEGHKLVEAEATTYGGDGPVVNPSGGLISKGHPLGATGLAQCSELTWQLRGTADARQVDGAKVALQHNIGLGGAAVVSVYKPAAA